MSLAITFSRAGAGIHAPLVTVETHISNGLPALNIVGLPEKAVKESKDRVRSAILNSHFEFPYRRITINLAPADLPKDGGRFDLSIALGILAASKQIPDKEFAYYEFAGELALSGELRTIQGALPFALATKSAARMIILPNQNAKEASLISDLSLLTANHLLEVCEHFLGKRTLRKYPATDFNLISYPQYQDLKEVKGQHHAKRALEIAAAGQHSLLLIGPPGTGKTMLSNCLPSILPPMTEQEALELATVYSVANKPIDINNWQKRPFRSPHHSASSYALIGGGNPPKPGEISLAHNGVLFLDELPEFKRQALESLREPLETGSIIISRSGSQLQYPAKFQLIGAMNPCPCGQFGRLDSECTCTREQIKKYQSRISGPLLDRIDLQIEVSPAPFSSLLITGLNEEKSSEEIRARVQQARNMQLQRAAKPNVLLSNFEIKNHCCLDAQNAEFLHKTAEQMKMSARSYHKILKIARTIADLDQSTSIKNSHLKEAFAYRLLDKFWAK